MWTLGQKARGCFCVVKIRPSYGENGLVLWHWDDAEDTSDQQPPRLGQMSGEPEHDVRGEDCHQVRTCPHTPIKHCLHQPLNEELRKSLCHFPVE